MDKSSKGRASSGLCPLLDHIFRPPLYLFEILIGEWDRYPVERNIKSFCGRPGSLVLSLSPASNERSRGNVSN